MVHLANFAMPAERGDFGSGAVEVMGPGHIFVALLDYGPLCRGTGLFESAGMPVPVPADFDRNGLQRPLPGQAGYQAFFTTAGRPLCLYAVIGSTINAAARCAEISRVLQTVRVEPI